MEDFGRWLMILGGLVFLLGGSLFLATRLGIPFGRLPGDIRIERENFSFYFPLASSLLFSLLLSLLIYLISKGMNK